jgi:hypothetical protein
MLRAPTTTLLVPTITTTPPAPTIIMDAAIIATVGGVMAIATAAGKSDYKKDIEWMTTCGT